MTYTLTLTFADLSAADLERLQAALGGLLDQADEVTITATKN